MKRYYLVLFVVASLLLCSASCSKLSTEHDEARNVEIMDIDFNTLHDGNFSGYYYGGMYAWRENECEVTVQDKKVTMIELISSTAEYTEEFLDTLYNRIIARQTLLVDAVSSATLDSKACLKAVEDALLKAVEKPAGR
jgi:uncharacterized protein with FMN-binding domain